jgi:hypothetical protein
MNQPDDDEPLKFFSYESSEMTCFEAAHLPEVL